MPNLVEWSRTAAMVLALAVLMCPGGSAMAQSGRKDRGIMVSKRTGVAVGSVWGLFVGVSKFDDSSLNLGYAAKDAKLLHTFFTNQFKGRVDSDHFVLLTDEKATRRAILKSLKDIARRAFPEDLVYIFIATHGLPNDANTDIFFFTPSTDVNLPSADGVSRTDLLGLLGQSKAGKVVIMLDACHAGTFSSAGVAFRGAEAAEVNRLLKGIGTAQDGVAVLMSSSAAERSQESDLFCGGHGAFTCALHDGLSGKANKDGNEYVELRELTDYVFKRVKEMSGGVQNPAIEGKFDNDLPLAVVEMNGAPDVSDYEKLAKDAQRLEAEKKRAEPDPDSLIDWVWSEVAGLSFARTETTVAQYQDCVDAGACDARRHLSNADTFTCNWGYEDRKDHPMNCVDWFGADQFCKWAGGRLPNKDEWLAEASNGGKRKYPWGDEVPTCARCVMYDENTKSPSGKVESGCGEYRTWPACSKSAGNSVSGLCDMSGNVWEWTTTLFSPQHDWRVVRGGDWMDYEQVYLLAEMLKRFLPDVRSSTIGFRCVRSSRP